MANTTEHTDLVDEQADAAAAETVRRLVLGMAAARAEKCLATAEAQAEDQNPDRPDLRDAFVLGMFRQEVLNLCRRQAVRRRRGRDRGLPRLGPQPDGRPGRDALRAHGHVRGVRKAAVGDGPGRVLLLLPARELEIVQVWAGVFGAAPPRGGRCDCSCWVADVHEVGEPSGVDLP
ncbi:hypothetical protein ABZ153_41645 [Streptomyces sp. NPDC006290]|uniref:hypothetical protein n=1 Tax=Streptomyces sp. NPDC006290 TaxID=3156745 RepID=UPI0033B14A91